MKVYERRSRRRNRIHKGGATDQQQEADSDSLWEEESNQSEGEEDGKDDRNCMPQPNQHVEGVENMFTKSRVHEPNIQVCQNFCKDSITSFPHAGNPPSISPNPAPQHSHQTPHDQEPKQSLQLKNKEPILASKKEEIKIDALEEEVRRKRAEVAETFKALILSLAKIGKTNAYVSEGVLRVSASFSMKILSWNVRGLGNANNIKG